MPPKSDTKEPTTASAVRKALEAHRYYINDPGAEKRGATLIAAASKIVHGDRASSMSDGRVEEVRDVINEYRNANELTFLINFWAVIVDLKRQVPAPSVLQDLPVTEEALTETQNEAAREWISKAWLKDHLRASWSTNFRPNSTPPMSATDDKVLDEYLKSVPRVKNPVPDLAYGIKGNAFTPREKAILESLGCELCSELFHVFFLVEAKSMNNPIAEAVNQCCRGGAAMTYNKRNFDAEVLKQPVVDSRQQPTPDTSTSASNAPPPPPPGTTSNNADINSFTFSLALDPDNARLFTHWAEEVAQSTPPVIIWHMHLLEIYNFFSPNDYRRLHHDVDNILDWGVGERLKGIKEGLTKIGERVEMGLGKRKRED